MEKHLLLSKEEQNKIIELYNLREGEYRVLPDGTFAIIRYSRFLEPQYILKTGVNMRTAVNRFDEYAYTFSFKSKDEALKHLNLLQAYTDIPIGNWISTNLKNRFPEKISFQKTGRGLFDVLLEGCIYDDLKPFRNIDKGLDAFIEKAGNPYDKEIMTALLAWLLENKRLYATVTKTNRDNTKRNVKFLCGTQDGKIIDLTGRIGKTFDLREDNGIVIQGCGEDVIFATLYRLLESDYGHKASKLADCYQYI